MSNAVVLAGVAAVLIALPALPNPLVVAVLTLALVLAASRRRTRLILASGAIMIAFVTAGQKALERRWPVDDWYNDRDIVATVISFANGDDRRRRFDVRWHDGARARVLRLSWYRSDAVPLPGERWQWRVRLRAPRGRLNPGGFDAERYWLAAGVDAIGYIVAADSNRRLQPTPPASVSALRVRLAATIAREIDDPDVAGTLIALATGSRHALTERVRALTAESGTAHLLAISGMHIGLAAAAGLLVGRLLSTPLSLSTRRPARAGAASLAFAVAAAYAALAGFALPTRRALVMLAIVLVLWVSARRADSWSGFALALAIVLLVWPLTVLTSAFLLSFGIVALLLLAASRDRCWHGRIRGGAFLRYQGLLSTASLVIGAVLFGAVPWSGFVANPLLIPLVSFGVVPLLAVGVAIAEITSLPLAASARLMAWGLALLDALSGLTLPLPVTSGVAALLAVGVVVWAPLPARLRLLLVGLALLATGVTPRGSPGAACATLHVLDVGQGLAVLLRTREHALLVDTGPSWSGGSAARQVVVPALRALDIAALDLVVLSHADNDHAGGARDLAADIPVRRWVSGEPVTAVATEPCRRGQRWQIGIVAIDVLGPPDDARSGNNASCVLLVTVAATRILLPGDIEAAAERELLGAGHDVAADIVLLPHHGSASSSTPEFVNAVGAHVAIAAAGFGNRWGFPAASVVRRWQDAGTRVLATGKRGALAATICSNGLSMSAGRRRTKPRWWRVPDRHPLRR